MAETLPAAKVVRVFMRGSELVRQEVRQGGEYGLEDFLSPKMLKLAN